MVVSDLARNYHYALFYLKFVLLNQRWYTYGR